MVPLRAESSEPEKALVSWKEIAAFLERAERTVKRWERERGLPVHRVPGGERGGVYAYPSELSAWLKGKSADLDADDTSPGKPLPAHPEPGEQATQQPQIGPAPAPASHRHTISPARAVAWLLPLTLTVVLVIYFSGIHLGSPVTAVGDREVSGNGSREMTPDSIAVLPFTNTGGGANSDYLSDGITESLIGSLAHVPKLKVRSRDAVYRLKGKNIEAQEAGKELRVPVVVTGRVIVQAKNIEVSAEITNVRDNTAVWAKQYAGTVTDLVQLQQQITGDIARELRSSLNSADTQRVTSPGTQNTEAYNLYLKGRYAWNLRDRPNLEASVSYFNQAIIKDPSYALAYSGLADAYSVLPNFGGNPNEDFPKSNAAARKALELDPTLARPHAVIGVNEFEYDWDFTGAESEFKQAIALDPNDATAHQWYAEGISQLGRHQEALTEIRRAQQLDPLSPVITRVMAGTYEDAGQFDQAIEICKHLESENPTLPIAHDCLAFAYWGKRMYPQMIHEWSTEFRLSGIPEETDFSDALDRGYRSAGWKGAFADAAASLEARRVRGYAPPVMIARFYADIGDTNKAFKWLDIAYREHDRLLLGLIVSPGLDNIRPDPRYAELLRKVGLPSSQQPLNLASRTP